MRARRRMVRNLSLARDITRGANETIRHRTAMMREAALSPWGVLHPEFVTMVAEKLFAAGEAALIATRHSGQIGQAWTSHWTRQWDVQMATYRQQQRYWMSGARFAWDAMSGAARLAALTDGAILAQLIPIHRTVTSNAKRLRSRRKST